MNWRSVCHLDQVENSSGVSADFGTQQVAVFKLGHDRHAQVFAIDNWDPLAAASVISRGLVGSVADEIVVYSPLYKHRYSLTSGRCLDSDDLHLKVYPARINGETIEVALDA